MSKEFIYLPPEHIHGKDIDKNAVNEELKRGVFETINEPDSGYAYVEKTEREHRMIATALEMIAHHQRSLGIEVKRAIWFDEQVHFVVNAPNDDGRRDDFFGECSDIDKNIYINNALSDYDTIVTLTHELLHLTSYRAIFFDKKTGTYGIRNGYDLRTLKKPADAREGFAFFNEAVTEKITQELLAKNMRAIVQLCQDGSLPAAGQAHHDNNDVYRGQREIVDTVIATVAHSVQMEQKQLWRQIDRGYFTGDMMYLRLYEKVYGRGFLRLLAYPQEFFPDKKITKKQLMNVFATTDRLKREALIVSYGGRIASRT